MNLTMLILGLMGAGGILLVFVGLSQPRTAGDEMQRRLERYSDLGGGDSARDVTAGYDVKDTYERFSEGLNRLLSRFSSTGKLADDLARADLKMKPSEWLMAVIGGGALLGFLLAWRFATPIAFLPAVPGAYFGSGFALKFLQRRRARAFDKQLGDTIILLSNALKAGYSFAQAMSTVSKTASPPIADEFARGTREIALGINVDDALNHMVKRNQSEDFDLMVTAVQIHRVVGGNLAEILDTIAFTIRERVRIKGEIRTLTAQARASGWIITCLPIGLAAVLSVISPAYFTPMFHETIGIIMLAIGGFSMAVGFAIIQKIVKIEV